MINAVAVRDTDGLKLTLIFEDGPMVGRKEEHLPEGEPAFNLPYEQWLEIAGQGLFLVTDDGLKPTS